MKSDNTVQLWPIQEPPTGRLQRLQEVCRRLVVPEVVEPGRPGTISPTRAGIALSIRGR